TPNHPRVCSPERRCIRSQRSPVRIGLCTDDAHSTAHSEWRSTSVLNSLRAVRSLGTRADGLRLERMRASKQWDGDGFRNVHPILPGLRDPAARMPSISEFLHGGERRVPRAPLPAVVPRDRWVKPPGTGLRATWLGHSTVLIEIEGKRILTDPVWGPRASPS